MGKVVYKNRTTWGLFQKEFWTPQLYENNSLHATSIRKICTMYFYVVSNSSFHTIGNKERTVKIQIISCVKWYKKSSFTRGSNCKALTVLWIGGCLW